MNGSTEWMVSGQLKLPRVFCKSLAFQLLTFFFVVIFCGSAT